MSLLSKMAVWKGIGSFAARGRLFLTKFGGSCSSNVSCAMRMCCVSVYGSRYCVYVSDV